MTDESSLVHFSKEEKSLSIGVKLSSKGNYILWRFAMLTLLRAHGLEDYIDSAKTKVATDLKKKAQAMHAITRNIEQDQLLNILSFDNDPQGAWEALREEHAGDTWQS
jgi:hypothetical protein